MFTLAKQLSVTHTLDPDGKWEEFADKYEDLAQRVHDYIDDREDVEARNPPIVKPPPTMTKDEWEKHKVTHTPYAPGCRHCAAARALRINCGFGIRAFISE